MHERASNLVVVGASAGGVGPLKEVLGGLPRDLAAAVAVVLHVPAEGSRLPSILDRAGPLPAAHAADGEPLVAGRVYIAPPDRHLLVRDARCVVVRGPRENGFRPAIDPLFRSAALFFRERVVAVVLSGTRSDGAAGAAAITARGGTVIVQDPSEAAFPGMPRSTIARDRPDEVIPVAQIAPAVTAAIRTLREGAVVRENDENEMNLETSYASFDRDAIEDAAPPGEPSAFSCPACGGVLWEIDDGGRRYRCRVGHAYTEDAVIDDEAAEIDKALWAAFRVLHEHADLSARSARRSRDRGANRVATRLEARAREALEQADVIRTILLERDDPDE